MCSCRERQRRTFLSSTRRIISRESRNFSCPAVNNLGDAVGYVSAKGVKARAAVWFGDEDDDGTGAVSPTILPTGGFCGPEYSDNSVARDINSSGMIVGVCGPAWKQKSFMLEKWSIFGHACRWTRGSRQRHQ